MDHADGLLVEVVEFLIVICYVPRLLLFTLLSDLLCTVDLLLIIHSILVVTLMIVSF